MERSWKVTHREPIALQGDEGPLADDIQERLQSILEKLRSRDAIDRSEIQEMAELAHKLHMLLTGRGLAPKHHKHMLKNRGVSPEEVEFYNHVHSVEDLLRFISNPHANDDPVDSTLGDQFEFRVYSRRWQHEDSYTVTRTPSGWTFQHVDEVSAGRDGRVGRKAGTGLFQLLDNDSINYPQELPGYFEWLWERAADSGLDHEEVQRAVTDLAEWTSHCEKKSPRGVFERYK